MTQPSAPGIDTDEKYVALTTYRSTGAMVTTPVWFVDGPHRLRVITGAKAGKVARIRTNERVAVSACDLRGRVTGPTVSGSATIVSDDEAVRELRQAVDDKYGVAAAGIAKLQEALGRSRDPVALVITLDG